MNDLLRQAIAGHGGARRWGQLARFRAAVSVGGAVWAGRGRPALPAGAVVEGRTRRQTVTITPFPRPGQYTIWEPEHQQIRTTGGDLVAELDRRTAVDDAAAGDRRRDDFRVAHVVGVLTWNYFVTPFVFAGAGFITEEGWPWREDGQTWRTLLVTYPERIMAPSRRQTCYFDAAGLLRRLDDVPDIMGGGPAAHYPSDYREFDGIMVPTRRLAYVRGPDGYPDRSSVMVDIDVSDVTFTQE